MLGTVLDRTEWYLTTHMKPLEKLCAMPASSTAGISVPLVLRSAVAVVAGGSCPRSCTSSRYHFLLAPGCQQAAVVRVTWLFTCTRSFITSMALAPNMFTGLGISASTE